MRPVFNSAQARRADEIMQLEYGYLGVLLMETAGRRAAALIQKLYPQSQRFIVVAGGGNNGGDGLVIARYLRKAGKEIFILLAKSPDKLSALSRIQYDILTRFGVTCHILSPDNLRKLQAFAQTDPKPILIDALIGVGLSEKLNPVYASLIDFLRSLGLSTVAVDLPSGLSGDTGALINEPLRCEHTITFQTAKICHLVTPAALYCGKVHVVDIGMYSEVIERIGTRTFWVSSRSIKRFLPARPPDAHKGSFGHALIVGGSRGKGGAAALATLAALRAGAGLATALIPGSAASSFHRRTLSGMSLAYGDDNFPYLNQAAGIWAQSYLSDKAAVAFGPGLGNVPDTQAFLREVLPRVKVPCILDADALNILASDETLLPLLPSQNCILTPHPGEAARLLRTNTEQVQARRLESALHLAQRSGALVLLKGANPIVATPKGDAYFFSLMEPSLATAGTGDVLTGLIVGFLAQKVPPLQAALLATMVQCIAARLLSRKSHPAALTAGILAQQIGRALAILDQADTLCDRGS
ncbi:MAG: NAD(P)H-hydrate dehydratase [Bacteroidia bacterium]|nr:NAD(P)H-hydrate dehydratase [Bacteroidia bacterium]MCX7651834.1 NAD(P)H-hydrate dehydratase [Bacteroidia bacterium]MDW8416016.1 NAD(P)H-hydrate dehydratase [Bacteroidia bacterium]